MTVMLLGSDLDPVEEVLVVSNHLTVELVSALRRIVSPTGAQVRALSIGDGNPLDIWVQDSVKITRVCGSTPGGNQQAILALASVRDSPPIFDTAPLDTFLRKYFEKRDVQVIDGVCVRPGTRWVDWYGNLQVSPPTAISNGHRFPFGRIITGVQHGLGMHPDVLALFEAQRLQWPPLLLDTSWLRIGHVDEVVSFVPAPERPGYRALVPDPSLARALLRELVALGLGATPVFENKDTETTVVELLERVAESDENLQADEYVLEIRGRLSEGLGLSPDQLIGVPALFENGLAVIPNCVNGLICNGAAILPDPFGPRIRGTDTFVDAIQRGFAGLPLTVHFVDVWDSCHVNWGEIHCATNTIRRVPDAHRSGWRSREAGARRRGQKHVRTDESGASIATLDRPGP